MTIALASAAVAVVLAGIGIILGITAYRKTTRILAELEAKLDRLKTVERQERPPAPRMPTSLYDRRPDQT